MTVRTAGFLRETLLPLAIVTLVATIATYGVLYWLGRVHGVTLENLDFERPWAAFLLLAAPLSLWAQLRTFRRRGARLRSSRGALLHELQNALDAQPFGWASLRLAARHALRASRALSLLLVGLALMGPRSVHAKQTSTRRGIDIVLTLDMSLSMKATDILPSRFQASQEVVDHFIRQRPNDRIGAVVFGEEAYTLLPLTTDKGVLQQTVQDLQLGMVGGQGTAIGNAIATSLNRLRTSDAKSRVIILLTDGFSNRGNLSPEQAADYARSLNVRLYTILMGESDEAPVTQGFDLFRNPIRSMGQHPINPELLEQMAETTGGAFFSVGDRRGLEDSFHRILNDLERSAIEEQGVVFGELFFVFILPALLLIVVEATLLATLFRRWP